MRAIKSQHSPVLRNGLPQAAYDELGQCFKTTSLAPVWDIFAAQLVVRGIPRGLITFGPPKVPRQCLTRHRCSNRRLNRNFYTAIPGMVTGLGLLFTFIAILFALLDVKLVVDEQTVHRAGQAGQWPVGKIPVLHRCLICCHCLSVL